MLLLLGQTGFLGRNFKETLESHFEAALWPSRKELDLFNQALVEEYIGDLKPKRIILAAGRSGGIEYQEKAGKELAQEHLKIQSHVLGAAQKAGVPRLVFFASSCLYPRQDSIPLTEEKLGLGDLEKTSADYALAKFEGVKKIEQVRSELKLDWTSVIASHVYGPHDHFDSERAHVIPALFGKCSVAQKAQEKSVALLGDGKSVRDFIYVQDLVDQVLALLDLTGPLPARINIGSARGTTIRELAALIAKAMGAEFDFQFNADGPSGAPYKVLNVEQAQQLGLKSHTSLEEGLKKTWAFCEKKYGK